MTAALRESASSHTKADLHPIFPGRGNGAGNDFAAAGLDCNFAGLHSKTGLSGQFPYRGNVAAGKGPP